MLFKRKPKRLKSKPIYHLSETDYNNILARIYSRLWWQIALGLSVIFLYSKFTLDDKIEEAVKLQLNSRGTQLRIDSLFKEQFDKVSNLDSNYEKKLNESLDKYNKNIESHLSNLLSDTLSSRLKLQNGYLNIKEKGLSFLEFDGLNRSKLNIEFDSFSSFEIITRVYFKKTYSSAPTVFLTFNGDETRVLYGKFPTFIAYTTPLMSVHKVTKKYVDIKILGNKEKDQSTIWEKSILGNKVEFKIRNNKSYSVSWIAIGN